MIQINARCRPFIPSDRMSDKSVVQITDGSSLTVQKGDNERQYTFSNVFGPEATQEDVFARSVRPILLDVVQGRNASVFHFGQTGSGKTYTLNGSHDHPGIIPFSVHEIFHLCEQQKTVWSTPHRYQISVSFLEENGGGLEDLQSEEYPRKVEKNALKVKVKQNEKKEILLLNAIERVVASPEEVLQLHQNGVRQALTYACNMGQRISDRVMALTIKITWIEEEKVETSEQMNDKEEADKEENKKIGKIIFVDLPGSERIPKTGGEHLRGTSLFIGRTLGSLGDVLSAVTDENARHIPFRNSTLTYLCSDCINRDAKVVLFIHISPTEEAVAETICSLQFGRRLMKLRKDTDPEFGNEKKIEIMEP